MLLYALSHARETISKERKVILCEGQMDTIAMHRAGFTNAVAPLGTAFTPEQAKLLKRYADTVYLAFDSDGAGQKAFLRALEYLLPLSVTVNMIPIPGGKDPDELYSHGGTEAVAEAVNGALPWLSRFSQMLPGLYDMTTPVGRGQAAGFMVSLFDLVKNPIERETYIREGAALLRVSEEALYGELRTLKNRRKRGEEFRQEDDAGKPAPAPVPAVVPVTPERSALLALFSLAVASPDNAREISDLLPPECLEGGDLICQALNLLLGAAAGGEPESETVAALNALFTEKNDSELGKILLAPPDFNDPVKALADSVTELRRITRRRRYGELTAEMRSCTDPERRLALMQKLQEVLKEK
jgi:DNA primase